jgi:hypothetical protein
MARWAAGICVHTLHRQFPRISRRLLGPADSPHPVRVAGIVVKTVHVEFLCYHRLDSSESWLAGSDPGLASMLNTFTRLTSGEDMPVLERIRPRRRSSLRSRRAGDPPRPLPQWFGRPQAAVLVWLMISIALLATALVLNRAGGGARGPCASLVACGRPAPTHRPGASVTGIMPGT